jgi:hypothetical protein
MLFQRRDEDVVIRMKKPLQEIRDLLCGKQNEIRRSLSPCPQPTNSIQ